MEGSSNKKTDMQIPPLPSLPPSHLGGQSSNNNYPNTPLAAPSHEINGNLDKAKGIALPPETTNEPNSEAPVVDLQNVEPADPNMESKKQKRILASREYSQRYRIRQLQYITKLEREVKEFETSIALNTPRVKYADRHNMSLRAENKAMRQKLSAKMGELMFKQAEHEELMKERDSLLQLHQAMQQQQAAQAFNPQMDNLGLNQPGLGVGIAGQFNRPALPIRTQMLDQVKGQFVAGQSFVDMNNMGMNRVDMNYMDMNNIDMNNMDTTHVDMNNMHMNPLDTVNNDDGSDLQNPGSSSYKFI